MIVWRDHLCDFPDDDDATLDAVLNALPEDIRGGLVHTRVPQFRLKLASPGAAVAIAMGVPGVLIFTDLTADDEVLVADSLRSKCECQVAALNSGSVRWTRLERIEAREDVWRAFHRVWGAHQL